MKNLKILSNSIYKHDIFTKCDFIVHGKRDELGNLCSQAVNVYCLSENVLYSVNLEEDASQLYDFKLSFPEGNIPKVVNMWYRDLYDSISVCFENGEIITLALGQSGVERTENFLIECCVTKLIWSPDEEYAIAISDIQRLLLLNSDYFVISEIDVQDSSIGEKELINVGWGKKETQFHGSEGKKAALKHPEGIDSSHTDDSRRLQVTWRGDSSLFAVGYFCEQQQMRRIKIFNNEGVLQCANEDLSGIEEPLFWKPQGNLITFSQQLPNKYVIAFMEKNGLKHGDFTIPSNLEVKDLCWNETSTILCVKCEYKDTHQEEILLWTTGNYHWYLKQKFSLNFISKDIWWDKGRANRLYILGEDGLHVLEWVFTVNTSYYSSCEPQSYVAVIDNDNILLTSFKEAVVPPPMSSYKLVLRKTVNQVIFPPSDENSVILSAVLCDGSIAFFSDLQSDPIIFSGFADKSYSGMSLSLGHWEWPTKDTLILCYSINNTTSIDHFILDGVNFSLKNTAQIDGKVITCNRALDRVILQTSAGELKYYNYSNLTVGNEDFSLPEPASDIKFHPSGIYSLSDWSRFYINGSQINLPSVSGNVTSFLLKDPYILLTTSSHKLITLQFNNIKCIEISDRKLERGSRLIHTSGNSVILQTPRGNLETIQPRALTILTIGNMINTKLYKSALYLMRKQRIDLNLIVDHNQNRFIKESQIFVQQVDPQWITLLITELYNDDVTKTSYNMYYKSEAKNNNCLNGSKVKTVCETLLTAMSAADESRKKYVLPVLSALVKIGEMPKAIKLANNDQSLQHLLFIVDVNKLYLEALGAYDLNAALKIAEKSQKDPKEYIPYLNSLREMEQNYMKYTIDKSLNRMNSALSHLSRCSQVNVEECIDFIKENALYPAALKLFKHDKERLSLIACLYGEHLFQQRCYEESGIMYLRGGDNEKAIQSFTRAGNWRQCMIITRKEKFSNEKCDEVAQNVSTMLSSSHKFSDAATIYLEWLSNVEKAVDLYIQGKYWKEAMYVAEKYNKAELLGPIKESLLETVEALIESVSGNKSKMEKYVARLQVVRVEKQNRPAFVYDDFSDTASDASSTTSRTKSFQSRSSKNTKKMNRKMWSLKEGNRREEEALVATLSQLIQSAEKCVGDVHSTCTVLLEFEEDLVAANLQTEMKNWLKLIDSSKKIIWPHNPEMNETDILDEKYKHPPEVTIMTGWEFEILKNIL